MDRTEQKVMYALLGAQRYPWEQGVAAQAALEQGEEQIWLPMAYDAVTRQLPDGRLAMLGSDAAVADSAAVGEVCFRAFEKTGDPRFYQGAKDMLDYLMKKAPRTKDGAICHNTRSFHEGYSPLQLWVDALYMVPPFLSVMGEHSEAYRQIQEYVRVLQDEETKLLFHICDTGTGRFIRRVRWATGNGWAMMGITRTAEEAKKQGQDEIASALYVLVKELILSMQRFQRENGRFNDILDDENSFADGTSGLMFAVAVYRNILAGNLPKEMGLAADRAVSAAEEHIDAYGVLHEVCGCPDFTAPGTSAEAQAAYLMARAWQRKAKE